MRERPILRVKGLPIQTILDTPEVQTLLEDEERELVDLDESAPALEQDFDLGELEAVELPSSAGSSTSS